MIKIVLDISDDVDLFRNDPDYFYKEITKFINNIKTTKIEVSVDSKRFSLMEFVIKNNNEKLFNFLIENGEDYPLFLMERNEDNNTIIGFIDLNDGYDFDIFTHSDLGKSLFLKALREFLNDKKGDFNKNYKSKLICDNRIPDFIINSLKDFDSFKEYYDFLSINNLSIGDKNKERLVSNLVRNQHIDYLEFILEKELINIDDMIKYSRDFDVKLLLKNVFLTDSLIFKKFEKENPQFIVSTIDCYVLTQISSLENINYIKDLGYNFYDNLNDIFGLQNIDHFKQIIDWTMPEKLLEKDFLNLIFDKFVSIMNSNDYFIENSNTLISMGITPDKYDFLKDANDVNVSNIDYLVEHGARIENSFLIKRLVANNLVKSLNVLHKKGFNVANTDNLYFGLENAVHKETINWFLKKGTDIYGETTCNKLAFFGISNKRDLNLIKEYLHVNGESLNLEKKSNIGNNFFNDFLTRSAYKIIKNTDRFDSSDLLSEILVNKKTVDCSGIDANGNTALHSLWSKNKNKPYDLYLFEELIKVSNIISNIAIKNNEGDTPIHILFKNKSKNFINIAKYILNNMPDKLDLFILNNENKSPMNLLSESDIAKEDFALFYNVYLNDKIIKSNNVNKLNKI